MKTINENFRDQLISDLLQKINASKVTDKEKELIEFCINNFDTNDSTKRIIEFINGILDAILYCYKISKTKIEIIDHLSSIAIQPKTGGEMSTKSTILFTVKNEMWYRDCNAAYNEETKTQNAIILEFDKEHRVETNDDGTRIIIEENTELYDELIKNFGY